MRRSLRSKYVNQSSSLQTDQEADFSIQKYRERTEEKEKCEEQLPAEYAGLLAFYMASVAVLTGAALQQKPLPKKLSRARAKTPQRLPFRLVRI